jgi:peptide/nickel transport system substrate-binding protein
MNLIDLHGALAGGLSAQDLDMIFINHGAFGDVLTRDLVHDSGESVGPTGSAESPVRLVRSSPQPEINGSYITSESDSVFEVKFTHIEPFSFYDFSYILNMTKGVPAYFEMPPSHFPSVAKFIRIMPDGKLSSESSLTINSTEYWKYINSNPNEDAVFKTIGIDEGQEPIVPVSQSGESTGATSSQPSGCLIATAAFGSELAPQVQLLRNFRDNHILSTASGSSFMNVFNAWYYSFSPTVADYEREQPWLQQTVRIGIYPLLGILQTAEKAYAIVPGEFGSISAGLVASSLIGAVYFFPIALSIKQVRRNRLDYRIAILIIAAVSVSVIVALLAGNSEALMATTALLVVSTVGISAVYASKAIWKLFQVWKR